MLVNSKTCITYILKILINILFYSRVTIMIRAGSVSHLTPKVIFETKDFYHPPSFIQGVFLQVNDLSLLKFNRYVEYSGIYCLLYNSLLKYSHFTLLLHKKEKKI